jgi:glycine/D-amino acid oxidase-like deaminating enzyme
MSAAIARGAFVISPATAEVYETALDGVVVSTREGDVVRAHTLVLANGYEMPEFVPAARHELVTSWAIATAPEQAKHWRDMPLIWEAADPYLYMRSTTHGRLIIGGEDEAFEDPDARERMTPLKIAALLAKAGARCPGLGDIEPEFAWSGVFGETEDSLPMIGRVPGRPKCLVAFGYGGNGITFSALAAQLLAAELEGRPDPDGALYALDRD